MRYAASEVTSVHVSPSEELQTSRRVSSSIPPHHPHAVIIDNTGMDLATTPTSGRGGFCPGHAIRRAPEVMSPGASPQHPCGYGGPHWCDNSDPANRLQTWTMSTPVLQAPQLDARWALQWEQQWEWPRPQWWGRRELVAQLAAGLKLFSTSKYLNFRKWCHTESLMSN